jgi:hypothetical protein
MPRSWYTYVGIPTATEFAKPSNYQTALVPTGLCAGGQNGCQASIYYHGTIPPPAPVVISSNIRNYFIHATTHSLQWYPDASGRKPYVYNRP